MLRVSRETNLIARSNSSEEFRVNIEDTSRKRVFVRTGNALACYKFDWREKGVSFDQTWHHNNIFYHTDSTRYENYLLFVGKVTGNASALIILRSQDGIQIFRANDGDLDISSRKTDRRFNNLFGWGHADTILRIGTFFTDESKIGLMTRDKRGTVLFYYLDEKIFTEISPYIFKRINPKIARQLGNSWKSMDTQIILAPVHHNRKQSSFVLWSPGGLEIHRFGKSGIELLLSCKEVKQTGNDKLLFGNFSGSVPLSSFLEIVHVTEDVLEIYVYDIAEKQYKTLKGKQLLQWRKEFLDSIIVFDTDGNGKDKIIYTGNDGIEVIEFATESGLWNTVFQSQSFDKPLAVIPGVTPLLLVQSQDGDELKYVTMIDSATESKKGNSQNATAIQTPSWDESIISKKDTAKTFFEPEFIIPEYEGLPSAQQQTIYWTDQFDQADILNNVVDVGSTHVRFSLPLISYKFSPSITVQILMNYNSGHNPSKLLVGEGWSLFLPTEYIIKSNHGSVFSDDEKYYLFSGGNLIILKQLTSESYEVELDGHILNGLTLTRDTKEERWILETREEKVVFGASIHPEARDSMQWGVEWPNWRGGGNESDAEFLQPVVNSWHINAREDLHTGDKLFYYYNEQYTEIGQHRFTTDMEISKIESSNNFRIDINYGVKNETEYRKMRIRRGNGELNVNEVGMENKLFMQQLYMQNRHGVQTISFEYETRLDKRLLTRIRQENENLFQFDYGQGDMMLLQQITGTHATVEFKYEPCQKPLTDIGDIGRSEISVSTQIKPLLDGRKVVTSLEIDNVDVKVMDEPMRNTITLWKVRSGNDTNILEYELITFKTTIAVVIETESTKEVHGFSQKQGDWIRNVFWTFKKTSVVKSSSSIFFAVADPEYPGVALFEERSAEIIKTVVGDLSVRRLAVTSNFLVTYDGKYVIAYVRSRDVWKVKQLWSQYSQEESWMIQMDLKTEIKTGILNKITEVGLQVRENMVFFMSVSWDGDKATVKRFLSLVTENDNGENYEYHDSVFEKMSAVKWENKAVNGDVLHYGYRKKNGVYTSVVKDYTGVVFQSQLNQHSSNTWKEKINEKIKAVNEANKNDIRDTVIFDTAKFFGYQLVSGGLEMEEKRIIFQGKRWVVMDKIYGEAQGENLIGAEYVLKEKVSLTDKNVRFYKLLSQTINGKAGNSLLDFSVDFHRGGNIVVGYPNYLAYQRYGNDSIQIVGLDVKSKDLGRQTLLSDENIRRESDSKYIITTRESNKNIAFAKEVLFRQVGSVLKPPPDILVTSVKHISEENRRSKEYSVSYRLEREAEALMKNVEVVPEGNKHETGWYEYENSHPVWNPTNVSITERWFDGESQELLLTKISQSNTAQNTKRADQNSENKIMDVSGKLEIANISPSLIKDEMYGHLGFENYENTNGWSFPHDGLVLDYFTLTGKNSLNLRNGGILSKRFSPFDQRQTYLGSTWIKGDGILNVKINTNEGYYFLTLNGSVKRRYVNWSYHEVIVDMQMLAEMYASHYRSKLKQFFKELEESNNLVFPMERPDSVRFGLTVTVKGPCSIDHVRFLPIEKDFDVKVFNADGLNSETILTNGNILRNNYIGTEIATVIDEAGMIEYSRIKSSTRTIGTQGNDPNCVHYNGRSELLIVPESGFFEDFSPSSFSERWYIDKPSNWVARKGILQHHSEDEDTLSLKDGFLQKQSAVRVFYKLNHNGATNGSLKFGFGWQPWNEKIDTSGQGDLLIYHDRDKEFTIVWINGEAVFEGPSASLWENFSMRVKGHATISHLTLLNRPLITITFFNIFGEQSQILRMHSVHTVLLSETLRDTLGRETVKTKQALVKRKRTSPGLFCFKKDFVTGISQFGLMFGTVSDLNPNDHGYPYMETVYAKTMLTEEQERQEFLAGSHSRSFSKKYGTKSGLHVVENLFPSKDGFRERVEWRPNESVKVTVLDMQGNEVAHYVAVQGFDHLLNTMEYDHKNRLTKILPPRYHDAVKTLFTLEPWHSRKFSEDEERLQEEMGTYYEYDESDNVASKQSADLGLQEFIYDKSGNQKYSFSPKGSNAFNVTYFRYSGKNEVSETGYYEGSIPIHILKHIDHIPGSSVYQQVSHFNNHWDPDVRGKIKTFTTCTEDYSVLEKVRWDSAGNMIKRHVVTVEGETYLEKTYSHGKVKFIHYPLGENGKRLALEHFYNQQGRLHRLMFGSEKQVVDFFWNPNGQLMEIIVDGEKTQLQYNSAGFLHEIRDKYFVEHVMYIDGGYGQHGFGDGIVMSTKTNATWSYDNNLDPRWFHFQPDEVEISPKVKEMCVRALQRLQFLSNGNKPAVQKLLAKSDLYLLPADCAGKTGLQLMKALGLSKRPEYSEFSFAYGSHQELMLSKFIENPKGESAPLTKVSFEKINGISTIKSGEIWEALKRSGFIAVRTRRNDDKYTTGKLGATPLLKSDLLLQLLQETNDSILYETLLKFMFQKGREVTSLAELETWILNYLGLGQDRKVATLQVMQTKQNCALIFSKLSQQNFFQGYIKLVINPSFLKLMRELRIESYAEEISSFLLLQAQKEIGESLWDIESFENDSNGNRLKFRSNQHTYEMQYDGSSNRLKQLSLTGWSNKENEDGVHYNIEHDAKGNQIMAGHLGINMIKYHPVTNRPLLMELKNGSRLVFKYDAQGERVFKRFYDSSHTLLREVFYARDDSGRVLMDQRRTFRNNILIQEYKTMYIYGPTGLIAFFRNNELYRVSVDHTGSIRVVSKNGRVVAAYDYLPYGEIMRMFGDTSIINYLFTGQEFDEETGLYNYHARMYDPLIGRFYQVDPKEQYFSPYVYAGNSPLSLVDPDGELATLALVGVCVLTGLVGTYLGGASANGKWWIGNWDFKSHGTWLGMIGGGIGGAFAPVGFLSSAATLTYEFTIAIGITGAYLQGAASNKNEWLFWKWDWKIPSTYAGLVQGFGSAVGLVGGLTAVHNYAGKLSAAGWFGKKGFITITYLMGGSTAYVSVSLAHEGKWVPWKWDKLFHPSSIMALVDGFDSGAGWPLGFLEVGKGFSKMIKRGSKMAEDGTSLFKSSKIQWIKNVLNGGKVHPAYKVVFTFLMTYYQISSVHGTFDLTKWQVDSYTTYEALLNGIFFGKDIKAMFDNFKDTSLQKDAKREEKASDMSNESTDNYRSNSEKSSSSIANTEKLIWRDLIEKVDMFSTELSTKIKETLKDVSSRQKLSTTEVVKIFERIMKRKNSISEKSLRLLEHEAKNNEIESLKIEDDNIKTELEQEGMIMCGNSRRKKRTLNGSCSMGSTNKVKRSEDSEAFLKEEKSEYMNGSRATLLTPLEAIVLSTEESARYASSDLIKQKNDENALGEISKGEASKNIETVKRSESSAKMDRLNIKRSKKNGDGQGSVDLGSTKHDVQNQSVKNDRLNYIDMKKNATN